MYCTVGWIHTDLAFSSSYCWPTTPKHIDPLPFINMCFFLFLFCRVHYSAKLAKLASRTNYLNRKPSRAIIWSLKRSHHRLTLPSLLLSGTRSIILRTRNLIRFWFCLRNVSFWPKPQVEWPHMACTKKPYGEEKNIGYLIMNAKKSPRPFLLVCFFTAWSALDF